MANHGIVLSWTLGLLASCAVIAATPPLFPSSRSVVQIDFEAGTLNELPSLLVQRSEGRWAIADSPQAVSGSQVLVRSGESLSVLVMREEANEIGGEVSIRMLLGSSGAGLACETPEGEGVLLEADPAAGELVLSRGRGEERNVVARRPAEVVKGRWVRLGLRCGPRRVVGYLDGKAVVRAETALGRARLALWADGGVTAQFDDLRYDLGSTD